VTSGSADDQLRATAGGHGSLRPRDHLVPP